LDFLILRWCGYSAGRVVHVDEAEEKVAGRVKVQRGAELCDE